MKILEEIEAFVAKTPKSRYPLGSLHKESNYINYNGDPKSLQERICAFSTV